MSDSKKRGNTAPSATPASSAPPLVSPLDSMLGYRLRRASMAMMTDAVETLREIDLSVGEASLLILVGNNPGCRQSDVGRTLAIKRANLSPLVSRMKARDLICDAPIDGRSLSLTLTEKGQALQKEAIARVAESNQRFEDMLPVDGDTLLAALDALR